MSGILMMAAAGGGGHVVGGNQSVSSTAASNGTSSASVTFYPDGTTVGNATGTVSSSITVSNWYSAAPITGIGSYYWININSAGWQPLTSSQGATHTGQNSTVSYPYSIAADSGGVSVVASGTIQLDVSNLQ
jgi:hypothetical protein